MAKATVFNVQRFCTKDGDGIRTTVFLKGCPLDCEWCHNPESKQFSPILAFDHKKCIGCGNCVKECHQNAILTVGQIDRQKCNLCANCVENCVGALQIWGEEQTAEQVFKTVLKDKAFYDNSGGGLTVSGGEPLANLEFTKQLLLLAKQNGINTCIETCGFAKWKKIEQLLPLVDTFLYDIKETDSLLHKKFTGVENGLILQNLEKLSQSGAKIVMRCPIIPTYNDREEHFKQVGILADKLSGVIRVEIMPYHPMGKDKSQKIAKEYKIKNLTFVGKEQSQKWLETISKHTDKSVIIN